MLQKLVKVWEVAIVPTASGATHPIHEPEAALQMASLPIRHDPIMRPVVAALSPKLPQFVTDDA